MKKLLLLTSVLLLLTGAAFPQENNPKFSGLMFGDYFYNVSSTTPANKDLNGFQFRRIYITTDYNVAENVSTRFRLEADQSSGSLTAGGKVGVMVKDAWVKWKDIFSGSDFFFGISPTPAFDISEGAWGHRFLEKTIMDLNGIVPSRDLGVDLKGRLDETGSVNYWIKIGNNSGNAPESNKYKRFYGLVQFKPSSNFMFTVYGDYASAPQVIDALDKTSKPNNSFVAAAFLNLKQPDVFSFGAEGFLKSTSNNYRTDAVSSLSSQTGFGISLWAYANLTKSVRLVARYDNYDPNTDKDKDGKSLILGGIDVIAAKNFIITPNIEAFTYQADFPAGTDKSDLIARVTFDWEF